MSRIRQSRSASSYMTFALYPVSCAVHPQDLRRIALRRLPTRTALVAPGHDACCFKAGRQTHRRHTRSTQPETHPEAPTIA
jgi:hypothetical protein